jgi:hypothetical protein
MGDALHVTPSAVEILSVIGIAFSEQNSTVPETPFSSMAVNRVFNRDEVICTAIFAPRSIN